MTAIPTDSPRAEPLRGLWCALALTLALAGCAPAEPPTTEAPRLRQDECLDEVKVDRLDQALERCDRVVSSYPRQARPLSDRFVIHTLRGEQGRACQDIDRAAELIKANGDGSPPAEAGDPQLVTDIRVRQESCRDSQAASSP
ncbi:MAG: hypothetical protein NTW83_07700 [Cyanobacteria bacterium]|nr:hypothetical protein [Cyanobacteriota bacterium]